MKPLSDVACTLVTPVTPTIDTAASDLNPVEWMAIRLWLESIGEQNPAVIASIHARCETEKKTRDYCLDQAGLKASSLDVGVVKLKLVVPSQNASALDSLKKIHAEHLDRLSGAVSPSCSLTCCEIGVTARGIHLPG